jgi:ectoine hydroxylase-related dioxygenase (phytanoyl-CoA dioxygenase family)
MNTSNATHHTDELSARDLAAYRTSGYVVARGRFARAEVAAWRRECERLWALPGIADLRNLRVEPRGHLVGRPVLDRLDPVIDLSPLFARLVTDRRILGAVASVLGEAATLLKCKLVAKRPGTKGYLMHQDHPYWMWLGLPPDHMLTVYVAIDPAEEVSGAVELFPGLHDRRLPAPPDEPMDVDESAMDTTRGETPRLEAGDLLLFHSLTPHRSAPNRSLDPRRALLPSYVAARYGELYERYDAHKRHVMHATRLREGVPDPFFR